jgi:hypothetical protein
MHHITPPGRHHLSKPRYGSSSPNSASALSAAADSVTLGGGWRRRRGTVPAGTLTACLTRRAPEKAIRIARDPARNQTETHQHRVSCSMVDRMEVQDTSAQRIASPRAHDRQPAIPSSSQQMCRRRPCAVCVQRSQPTAPSRSTTRSGGCVCSPPPPRAVSMCDSRVDG